MIHYKQLSLVNPIRQGQTRYFFLVMQFDREEEIRAELNIEEYVSSFIHAQFDANFPPKRRARKI